MAREGFARLDGSRDLAKCCADNRCGRGDDRDTFIVKARDTFRSGRQPSYAEQLEIIGSGAAGHVGRGADPR